MKVAQQLKITKSLFFISLILSAVSFFISTQGYKEIYPFFYWKLYTQPLGNTYLYNDYKIYGTIGKDTIRVSNKGYENFNKDDYYYFLTKEASIIASKKYNSNYHKKRIYDFGQAIAPNFKQYILMKESFNPIEIAKDSTNYTKEIILIVP